MYQLLYDEIMTVASVSVPAAGINESMLNMSALGVITTVQLLYLHSFVINHSRYR